jgi:hypothetical protein
MGFGFHTLANDKYYSNLTGWKETSYCLGGLLHRRAFDSKGSIFQRFLIAGLSICQNTHDISNS